MRWLVIGLVCLVSEASADDKANIAAAKKQFERRVSTGNLEDDWVAKPLMVFPGTLGFFDDDRAMSWRFGPPYLGDTKVAASVGGWSGKWGWVSGDVAITQRPYSDSSGPKAKSQNHRYHITQVFVLDGKVLKGAAMMAADTKPDAKLVAGAAARSTAGPLAQLLAKPGGIKLAADPNVAVLGSSDGEVGLGAQAAGKLLASWKNLKLALVGQAFESFTGDLGVAASELDLELKGKTVRLRGFLVARKTATGWEAVVLQYGADSDFGDPTIGP